MSATIYSQRLGAISDAQFAAATSRLGLGAFLSASSIAAGMHGQNAFITTDMGEFVLRGAPHWVKGPNENVYRRDDRVQFTSETFFVRHLHEHTRAPAPWPHLHDETSDIFGWPYVIMARTPGACFNERTILKMLAAEDRREIAAAAGATLAEMQRLTSPFAGGFDVNSVLLTPDPAGYTGFMVAKAQELAVGAGTKGVMTTDDMDWVSDVIRRVRAAGARPITFQHGDYKLDNMTVARDGGRWRIGGVFDFQTARFGDGAFDLVHQTCGYLDTEPASARVFIDAWREAAQDDEDLAPWMPLYLVTNRLSLWLFFSTSDERPTWSRGKTFRGWAEPYLERMLNLL
jgi:aminoglycoside phosphotransferase (APT) family kinase protein